MKHEKAASSPSGAGKLVVLGGGESGTGAAILGQQKGFEVFVSDKGKLKENYKNVLKHFEIDWEEGQHNTNKIYKADLVVKSPGLPDTLPVIKALRNKEIPVISEIEFASAYTSANLIGITGTNGKTTTTMLTWHILKQAGLDVGMAGNVGKSFARAVAAQDPEHYVLELSSFQLDGIIRFAPHIAVITNIVPDHLDRYEYIFEKYIASKFRIIMNHTGDDYLIYNADDEVVSQWIETHPVKSKLLPFSIKKKVENGAYIENNTMIVNIEHNNPFAMSVNTIALQGSHNLKNAMAAAAVAQLLNIRKKTIRESLENFQSVEHRLEKVLKIKNVTYINDSKATNINAAFYALDSVKAPVIWIVGGQDKGNDYTALMPLVREKVKAIICLGIDNSKIVDAFGNVSDFMAETVTMQEAVKTAYKISERGDTVLLSPACASFDLFKNYEDRGKQFKEAVRTL